MADRIIKIITPATSYDLMTLDELKVSMSISPTDSSQDALLQQYITRFSDVVARTCNRTFGYETVSETWRCPMSSSRLFLSHYPVDETTITKLESPRGTAVDPSNYEVEPISGKIELLQGFSQPVDVIYSGGYNLPNEAPNALKEATELMIREAMALAQRLLNSGIRMIGHKEARVMFFDPLALLMKTQGFGWATTSANALLMHYTRFEA